MRKFLLMLSFCTAVGCLFPPQARAIQTATPGDETCREKLTNAIERLEQESGYRWTANAVVPEGVRFRPGPTQGTIARDGKTHVSMSFGPRSVQIVLDGEKAVVTNRDGRWETIWLSNQGYSSQGFAASVARDVKTPAEQATTLAASLTSLQEEDGVLVGTLPVEATKDLLTSWREGEGLQDMKATVRFYLSDGLLKKYVVDIEAKLALENQTSDSSWRFTVEVNDIGTAKLDLPPGASNALRRSIPRPEPRLSDAEEVALLNSRGKRDVGVHDPSSIVECAGEYWFFSTGTGVSSWHSKDLQTWESGPRVLPMMPSWVTDVVPGQRGHFWAPDIIQLDDRYLLYYSVSSFGKNTSAIALASTPTLNPNDPTFGWTDHGIVIQTNSEDDFNAIDPAIILTKSGELWMSLGSFWSGLKLIQLDPKTGMREQGNQTIHSIASYRQIEAPHIYQHDGWFHLFVNWGKCCSGTDSTYNIRVGRSRAITGPYLDQDGVDLADGGGTLLLGSEGPFIGPGHANVFRDDNRFLLSCHYYDGTERGRSKLSIQKLFWSKDGWPTVADHPGLDQTSKGED